MLLQNTGPRIVSAKDGLVNVLSIRKNDFLTKTGAVASVLSYFGSFSSKIVFPPQKIFFE